MANTPCLLNNLSVTTISRGSLSVCNVNAQGDESGQVQARLTDEPTDRYYTCNNCNNRFDGTRTFEEAKNHLGRINEHIPKGIAILNSQ